MVIFRPHAQIAQAVEESVVAAQVSRELRQRLGEL